MLLVPGNVQSQSKRKGKIHLAQPAHARQKRYNQVRNVVYIKCRNGIALATDSLVALK
jgi:hypothetical protein